MVLESSGDDLGSRRRGRVDEHDGRNPFEHVACVGRLLTTIYQGTENSSDTTRDAAAAVAAALGAKHLEWDVGPLVAAYTAMVAKATGRAPDWSTDDLALQKIMTKLPPAQGAVRKTLDSKDAAGAKEQATILKDSFTQIEAFFKTKNNPEALKWATEGKNHADAILLNLGLNNIEAAKTSITPLGGTCASCHGKYRERMDDGTFRLKTAG